MTLVIVGTLFGLFLFKKLMNLKETTIIMIGLVSSSARTFLIAFASQDWHMYIANVVGIFAGLVQPAIVSFIVQVCHGFHFSSNFEFFFRLFQTKKLVEHFLCLVLEEILLLFSQMSFIVLFIVLQYQFFLDFYFYLLLLYK